MICTCLLESKNHKQFSVKPFLRKKKRITGEISSFNVTEGDSETWSEWSTCSETCGVGLKTRYRNCSDVFCSGEMKQSELCLGDHVFCEGRTVEIHKKTSFFRIRRKISLIFSLIHRPKFKEAADDN